MLGNKIVQRAFTDRHLPLASALSGALLLFVLVPVLLMSWRERRGRA
jgi:spermidine/putrescine transport system permease protein